MYENKVIGALGERYAVEYLVKKHYKIIELNPNSRWGELDIVAEKNNIIYFIEVKTRKDIRHGRPYEGVTRSKIQHLKRTITHYILTHKTLQNRKFQLDVIGILLDQYNVVSELRHYENLEMGR